MPLAVEQLRTVCKHRNLFGMVFWHVKNRTIAQQIDLEVGDLPLHFIQKVKFFMALMSVPYGPV